MPYGPTKFSYQEIVYEAAKEFNGAVIAPNIIRTIEGGLLSYQSDFGREHNPFTIGLDRLVDLDQDIDFIGKEALTDWQERGAVNGFVTMEVLDVVDADARGSEAIYKDGMVVGRGTSGGYGWRCGKSLALGIVRKDLTAVGTELEIEILGEKYKSIVIDESPFDPNNQCLRS